MSISSQFERVENKIAESYDAVEEKGGTLPSVLSVDNLPNAIESIPQRVFISYSTIVAQKPESKLVLKGYQLTDADLPELAMGGYVFYGWWDKDFTKEYVVGDEINEDVVLKAKWIEAEATGLKFTAENNATITTIIIGTFTELPRLMYSLGAEWRDFIIGETKISLEAGQSVWIKAADENESFSQSAENRIRFAITGKIACSGSIQYLLNINAERLDVPESCYYSLFGNCNGLTQAPELPATNLSTECYNGMFRNCTSLTQAPELPATTLVSACYKNMFSNCTGLTTAPELPATTLASGCYYGMFSNCTGLTTAPELPATTLVSACYKNMFSNCTRLAQASTLPATNLSTECYNGMFRNCASLTQAPELPATTLTPYCYEGMFSGCTLLNYIKVHFNAWHSVATNNWVNGVAEIGTFICPNALSQEFGVNRIPEGWTVETFEDEVDNVLRQVSGSTNEYSRYFDRINNMYHKNKLNDLQILVDTHFITNEEKQIIMGGTNAN